MLKPLLFLIIAVFLNAQEDYSFIKVNFELLDKERPLVRKNNVQIELNSIDEFIVKQTYAVTVFNQAQWDEFFFPVYFNKNSTIEKLEARIYNLMGSEIEKFKEKEFTERPYVDGFSLYSDDRFKYLDFTPKSYPITIEFYREQKKANTLFIEDWRPFAFGNTNIQESKYTFINNSGIDVKTLDKNFETFDVTKVELPNGFSYALEGAERLYREPYAPPVYEFLPHALVVAEDFNYEGETGNIQDWKEYGKYVYNKLLNGRQELPQNLKTKIRELTATTSSDLEKVKILYKYLQENTRYVSVQIGIGGLRTDYAKNVSEGGFGDCKGLSNLMMAMLREISIPSNYTIVNSGKNPKSFNPEFASKQGNHVILHVPMEEDTIWLECTSQQNPFNHLGSFTDYRTALAITPEGGKLVKTQSPKAEENLLKQKIIAEIAIDASVKFDANTNYQGFQYDLGAGIQFLDSKDAKETLLSKIEELKNPELKNYEFSDNWDDAQFIETFSAESKTYIAKAGSFLVFEVIPLNKINNDIQKDTDRRLPLWLKRPWVDEYEIHWEFPEGKKLSKVPENQQIENEFGAYSIYFEKKENGLIVRRRELRKQGRFSPEKFNEFIDYLNAIEKLDHTKIILE